MNRPIALMTDFKISDPFIGVMKGVILSININAIIVDLAHNIPSFDVRSAAFKLLTAYKYFPKETIFCCVIDPGVGTTRRGIAIKTKSYYFVGPDNGCMVWAADDDGIVSVVALTNRKYMLPKISTTFHGRDIFAPVSAYLSLGLPIEELGEQLDPNELVRLPISEPKISENIYELEVITYDGFGNIFLNIPTEKFVADVGTIITIKTQKGDFVAHVGRTFGDVPVGSIVVLKETSHGFLEIAVNQGSAREKLGVKTGDKLRIVVEKKG